MLEVQRLGEVAELGGILDPIVQRRHGSASRDSVVAASELEVAQARQVILFDTNVSLRRSCHSHFTSEEPHASLGDSKHEQESRLSRSL